MSKSCILEPAGLEALCENVFLTSINKAVVRQAQLPFCVSASGDSHMYRLPGSLVLQLEVKK